MRHIAIRLIAVRHVAMRHIALPRVVALAIAALAPYAAVVAPADLTAQATARLSPGARVRVRGSEPGAPWREGVLLAAGTDSLRLALRESSRTERYSLGELSRVDVASGRRTYGKRGALVGAGVGAALGIVGGVVSLGTSCGTTTLRDGTTVSGMLCSEVRPGDIPAFAAVGAVLVAPLGALAGRLVHGTRWTPVVTPTSTAGRRVGAVPRPGGVAIGASFPFGGGPGAATASAAPEVKRASAVVPVTQYHARRRAWP